MATVFDVAAYVLNRRGVMSAMKLQKLCYYAQAWSLVWDDKPLFEEEIQAWANGPVCPALYDVHRGRFDVGPDLLEGRGNPDVLNDEQQATVDAVLGYYGGKPSTWLSELTHSEAPWVDARADLTPGMRGNTPITLAAMAEYYGSLYDASAEEQEEAET